MTGKKTSKYIRTSPDIQLKKFSSTEQNYTLEWTMIGLGIPFSKNTLKNRKNSKNRRQKSQERANF